MPPKKKTEGVVGVEDELISTLAAAINKSDDANAFFLGEEEAPTDLNMWVSTGSSELDVKISNRKYGGLAFGRIYEFSGLQGSGKSLLCAHIMANVQKDGGVAVLIDTENAVNIDFFNAVGVSLTKPNGLYVQADSIESVFDKVEQIIEIVRQSSKDRKVVIVVDSIAGASTLKELEAEYVKAGYNTDKSQIIGQAMRRLPLLIAKEKVMLIFTNQLRQKMNASPWEDQYVTPGGIAIPFTASVRLRLQKANKIKSGDNVVGLQVKVSVEKNRLGPPNRTAMIDVYFDRGIDDDTSMLKYCKDSGIIRASGAWFTYVDSNGEEHKFQTKTFTELLKSKPELRTELYEKLCDSIIMSYKTDGISTADESVTVEKNSTDFLE